MSISPIVEKVQKLLALSKSSNANEAAAAAAKANMLIDQYRLSEADLEASSEVEMEPIEEDPDFVYESGKITQWKHSLVMALSKHYGCAVWNDTSYATGRKTSRYRLVGKRSDIGITRYMFTWLMMECQRLADKEAKGCGRVFVASYCQGFVNGVSDQLKASRTEAQKDATSNAIIKIDARWQASYDAMHKMHNLVKTRASSQAHIDPTAFGMGRQQGASLHLGARMSSGGTKLLGS